MSSDIQKAIEQICDEKNIPIESVISTIEAALAVAYRKDFGEENQNVVAEFQSSTGGARIFDEKTVTDKVPEEPKESDEEEPQEEINYKDLPEEERPFDPRREVTVEQAQELKKGAKVGDVIRTELEVPGEFGRMAAQTAKQVIIQKLREAERETIYEAFKDRADTLINGSIQRVEGRMVLVDIGNATGLMPPPEQIRGEHYDAGARMKFYITSVSQTPKGPEIIVSRSAAGLVAKLFEIEVPEIDSGVIEIKAIAREAGSRTKIAVHSTDPAIDPVGSCVGQRGTRVQTVISEIGGEKIDIIEWDDDVMKFISNSLSPAKVLSVNLNEEEKLATVEVKEDQLSLAIGKAGQNVRLSSNISGWKIDIVSEGGESAKEKEDGKDSEDSTEEKESDDTTEESKEETTEEAATEEKPEEVEAEQEETKEEETSNDKNETSSGDEASAEDSRDEEKSS